MSVDADLAYLKDRLQGRDLDALVRVEAELSRLRSDPDGVARWRGEAEMYMREFAKQRDLAETAEARCARLQELLREWRDLGYVSGGGYGGTLEQRTDEALAGPDTPAEEVA